MKKVAATKDAATAEQDQTALVGILRDVEHHAAGLLAANHRLAERGLHDAQFTAIHGGSEFLKNWRRWVAANVGIRL